MSNRFTSLSPACLRSQYRRCLIIAALCFNYLPLSVQTIIPLSDPGTRNQQVERRRPLLSAHGYSVSPDLAQSQASQNPPGQAGQQDQPIRVKTELIDLCWWICVSRGSFLLSPLGEFRLHRDRVLAIRATEDWHLRKEKKACAHAIPVQPSE